MKGYNPIHHVFLRSLSDPLVFANLQYITDKWQFGVSQHGAPVARPLTLCQPVSFQSRVGLRGKGDITPEGNSPLTRLR
jgi:hypothetical protein